jgi:hypothetical protein
VQREVDHQGELTIISPWCGAQLSPGFCCTETRILTIAKTINAQSRNDQESKRALHHERKTPWVCL